MNIIETSLTFRGLAYGNNPNKIVLHHSEASKCTIQDIHSWHLDRGWAGCGYHFFVRKDGSIYRGRPENAIGAHCPGANDNSIGICAEGNYVVEIMPEAQKRALIELGMYIRHKYGLAQVYGHRDLYSTDCPGSLYPLQEIAAYILTGGYNVTVSSKKDVNLVLKEQIKALQYNFNKVRDTSLDIDGVVGTNTIKAVNAYIISKGESNNIIKWIQQKLQLWGYSVKNISGIYDETTFQAVTELQKNWGLATDGIIGPKTWNIFLNN